MINCFVSSTAQMVFVISNSTFVCLITSLINERQLTKQKILSFDKLQKFVFVRNVIVTRLCIQKCNKRLIIVFEVHLFLVGLEISYASSYALCAKLRPSIISSILVSGYQIKYSMTLSKEHFLETINRERPPDGN